MNRKAYIGVVLGALAVLLLAVNVTIYQRENLLSEGQTTLPTPHRPVGLRHEQLLTLDVTSTHHLSHIGCRFAPHRQHDFRNAVIIECLKGERQRATHTNRRIRHR